MANFYDKFSAEVLDFDVDCTDVLVGGDTIQSASISITSGGISLNSFSFSNVTKLLTIWVAGGTAGYVAQLVATITTVGGRVRQSPISILIKPLPQ
jgi:hypothetical protein